MTHPRQCSFSTLEGKILNEILIFTDKEIVFYITQKERYRLFHLQEHNELVIIKAIEGDVNDILGKKIIATTVDIRREFDADYDSCTSSTYRLFTNDSCLTIRYLGFSDGGLSETLNFIYI